MMTDLHPCPCYSGKHYSDCCAPYHLGQLPENALLLMRSRYSAYALDLPEYIMATTHPLNKGFQKNKEKWRTSIAFFSQNTVFKKLEILHFEEKGKTAYVTFIAYLEQNHHDATFQEKSVFEKVGECWLYLEGVTKEKS
ncbi:MAG: YchJ family metal-binding protein [Chlamydiota bacterium]